MKHRFCSLCAVALLACGGSSNTSATSTAASQGGSGGGTTSGAGGASAGGAGGTGLGGFLNPQPDAGAGAWGAWDATAPLDDGGLFDCGGCACDGRTHYCVVSVGGLIPPAPDAGPCGDGGSGFQCKPLPEDCLAPPSCGCIHGPYQFCQCEDVGGGLRVICNFP